MSCRLIITFLFTLIAFNLVFAKPIEQTVIIDFKIINNHIILKLPNKNGKMMNLIFDSASNDFLLDSTVAKQLKVKIDSVKGWKTTFLNGNVDAQPFGKNDIFKDDRLNQLYSRGSVVNLASLSKLIGVKLDGLVGLNNYMKIDFGINFINNKISINDFYFSPESGEKYYKINMIYSDEGSETKLSEHLRKLPCAKISCQLSDSLIINANLLFDSGFNKNFALLTTLDTDGIIKSIKKTIHTKNKKISLGDETTTIYAFQADSIAIDNLPVNFDADILLNKTSSFAMSHFGNSKWMCLAGVDFFRKFTEIHFDFIKRQIYLKPTSETL